LAKDHGFETLEEMKQCVIDADIKYFANMSKDIMRRDLLDKLSDMYDFPIPENMLNVETNEVVRQIGEEAKKLNKEFTEHIKKECVKIAEKRVRLGFVVAEIAKEENISVTRNEIAQSIEAIARMYPGNEKAIWNAYSRKEALPVVVGPILESKVVDFLLDKIKVSEEVNCTVMELIAIDEEPFDFFKDDTLLEAPSEALSEATQEATPEIAAETPPKEEEKVSEDVVKEKPKKTKKSVEKKSPVENEVV
jgi:trigger factor